MWAFRETRGRLLHREGLGAGGVQPAPSREGLRGASFVKKTLGSIPKKGNPTKVPLLFREAKRKVYFLSFSITPFEVAEGSGGLPRLRVRVSETCRSRSSGCFGLRGGGCRALSENFGV